MDFDTSNDPRSIDFNYEKYSLKKLDEWVNDAINCENLTPQDIYDTIVKCVDDGVEYHKKHLTRNIELLSLLKGNPPSDYIEHYETTPFSEVSEKDWEDFWFSPEKTGSCLIGTTSPQATLDVERYVTYEEYQEAKSIVKTYERQANMREQAYYDARAKIDADYEKQKKELKEIRKQGGFEWAP